MEELRAQQRTDYELRSDGALLKHGRVCMLDDSDVKKAILEETHSSIMLCILAVPKCIEL